jgi:hypothetical protein
MPGYPIDIACEVFTRINTGGIQLSLFEIMVAKTYDLERNFDLAQEYDWQIDNKGAEGVYYYYHLMAKALTAQGVRQLNGPSGKTIAWKNELAAKLISLQKPDASWQNSTKRWMEGDPNLTTAYVLAALALIGQD